MDSAPNPTPPGPKSNALRDLSNRTKWWHLWLATWIILLLVTLGTIILGSVAVGVNGDANYKAEKHQEDADKARDELAALETHASSLDPDTPERAVADERVRVARKRLQKKQTTADAWSIKATATGAQVSYGWGAIGIGIFAAVAAIAIGVIGISKTSDLLSMSVRAAVDAAKYGIPTDKVAGACIQYQRAGESPYWHNPESGAQNADASAIGCVASNE